MGKSAENAANEAHCTDAVLSIPATECPPISPSQSQKTSQDLQRQEKVEMDTVLELEQASEVKRKKATNKGQSVLKPKRKSNFFRQALDGLSGSLSAVFSNDSRSRLTGFR